MEAHDRAMARQSQANRAKREFADRQHVSTVDDIKRVLSELDPHNRVNSPMSDAPVSAQISTKNAQKQNITVNVSANTSSKTHRDMILEAIGMLRKRRELSEKLESQKKPVLVNGREMNAPDLLNLTSKLAIDPIIERVTGGHRDGELICWDLDDGYTYKYDIFRHKLTRIQRERHD